MQVKQLSDGGTRTFAVVFDTGDEVTQGLLDFATEHGVRSAHFTALGAFRHAVLGYFDFDRLDYDRIPVGEQVEVAVLTGNVAVYEGAPKVHVHGVLARRDGSTVGGHLLEGVAHPTLEVTVVETPETLRREMVPALGIPLIKA